MNTDQMDLLTPQEMEWLLLWDETHENAHEGEDDDPLWW